jgi:hypothetical protein
MAYNPYDHYGPQRNPLSRGQKIALGVVVGVAAVGTIAAIILIPATAKADVRPSTPDPVKPKPKPTSKPDGSPPPYYDSCFPEDMGGSQTYDQAYWDGVPPDAVSARARIFAAFNLLGYQTPPDRSTMNDLGTDGKLGGDDDIPNPEVTRFQKNYNAVSRTKIFAEKMGGLWEDGKVGPCTLNGLKYVMDNLGERDWTDIVAGKLS